MKLRKSESHRALLIPVLLVLAAAFLATSLGSFDGNDITGAQSFNKGVNSACEWIETTGKVGYGFPTLLEVICPANKPRIMSGGCEVSQGNGDVGVWSNRPINTADNTGNVTMGWRCGFFASGYSTIPSKTNALCCK